MLDVCSARVVYGIAHLQPIGLDLTPACHQNLDNKMFVSPSLRREEAYNWYQTDMFVQQQAIRVGVCWDWTDWHAMPAHWLGLGQDRVSAKLTEQNMQHQHTSSSTDTAI